MKTALLLLASILTLAGCATAPVTAGNTQAIPSDRLLPGYRAISTPAAETVAVTFVRDSGMLGAAAPGKLSIDGVDIAKLRNSERLDVYLKPGNYIFGIVPSPQLGGALIEESFSIEAGKHHYFRISVPTGGAFAIQRSSQLD